MLGSYERNNGKERWLVGALLVHTHVLRHQCKVHGVRERPQLEGVLHVALTQLRHLLALVRFEGIGDLDDAPEEGDSVVVENVHSEGSPVGPIVDHFPTTKRCYVLLIRALCQAQVGSGQIGLDTFVSVLEHAIPEQNEVVLGNNLVFKAEVRHANVVVLGDFPASPRLDVHDLSKISTVHRRQFQHFWKNVVEVPIEIVAFESSAQFSSQFQRLQVIVVQLEAFEVEHKRGSIKELSHAVHPHVCHSDQILLDRLFFASFRSIKLVWRLFEHMTHS